MTQVPHSQEPPPDLLTSDRPGRQSEEEVVAGRSARSVEGAMVVVVAVMGLSFHWGRPSRPSPSIRTGDRWIDTPPQISVSLAVMSIEGGRVRVGGELGAEAGPPHKERLR